MSNNITNDLANVLRSRESFMQSHHLVAFAKGTPNKFLMNTGETYTEDELKKLILENTNGCIELNDGEKIHKIAISSQDESAKLVGVPRNDCGTPENIEKLKSVSGLDKLLNAARME